MLRFFFRFAARSFGSVKADYASGSASPLPSALALHASLPSPAGRERGGGEGRRKSETLTQ